MNDFVSQVCETLNLVAESKDFICFQQAILLHPVCMELSAMRSPIVWPLSKIFVIVLDSISP